MEMKCRSYARLTAVVLLGVLTISTVWAGIDDTWDWQGNKRSLKIKLDDPNKKLGDKTLKQVMDEAMANWNNANAGWTLSYAGASESSDIDVSVGTIANSSGQQINSGGGVTSGFGPKTVNKLNIKFDPKPKEGFTWGMSGKKKMDPVAVAKHELSHCLRLDHEGGVDTGNLADPFTPGNHERTPSARDKRHATKAAVIPKKKITAMTGGGQPVLMALQDWSHDEGITGDQYPFLELPGMTTSVAFLDWTFPTPVMVEMYQTKGKSVPDRFSMPGEISPYERFVRGLTLLVESTAVADGLAIQITIPYFDNVEDMDPALPEELLDLADPEWGAVQEMELYPVMWNPLEQHWDSLMATAQFYIAPGTNQVFISVPSDLLTQYINEDGWFETTIGVGGPHAFRDCNGNGIDDGEDLADYMSSDVNNNGIPDECDMCPEPLMGDITGPEGEPDCCVDMLDFSALAANWLECIIVILPL